jgi:glyoxylase-like metal-dependent hydrolase (beta-lactamase superfamily II)
VAQKVLPDLYRIGSPAVNAFLITDGELVLVDTQLPGRAEKLLGAVRQAGRQASDVRHIVVTHYHPDHIGSLAAVAQATGASVYVHPADAGLTREGGPSPPRTLVGMGKVLMPVFRRVLPRPEPAPVHHELQDGEELPGAGGLRAIHTPGHTPGHTSYLWPRHGGVLFVGDALSNAPVLGYSLGYEDLEAAKRSMRKLAALEFQVAVFGHGRVLEGAAASRFRRFVDKRAR